MPPIERLVTADVVPGSVGQVLGVIRAGHATSRSAIARLTGLAPSTVSARVDTLTRMGLVTAQGEELSRGGRPARSLSIPTSAGVIAAVELHVDRARLVVADLRGVTQSSEPLHDLVTDDPADFVAQIWPVIQQRTTGVGLHLHGVAIGVPAPVEYPSGRIVTASFRPTWHEADLPALFAERTDVPVLIENDANLLALAESGGGGSELLAVKLGSRIGCGVMVGGRLHRGIGGAAGEVSHNPVEGVAVISCACGVERCLEAVASGAAIVARLQAAGHDVRDVRALVQPALGADPVVIEALRDAGTRIGTVLSTIVNFMNPGEVVLGGTLATSAPLVAAVRAALFGRCLPMVAADLNVRAVAPEARSILRGAVLLALDEVQAPAPGDRAARERDQDAGASTVREQPAAQRAEPDALLERMEAP